MANLINNINNLTGYNNGDIGGIRKYKPKKYKSIFPSIGNVLSDVFNPNNAPKYTPSNSYSNIFGNYNSNNVLSNVKSIIGGNPINTNNNSLNNRQVPYSLTGVSYNQRIPQTNQNITADNIPIPNQIKPRTQNVSSYNQDVAKTQLQLNEQNKNNPNYTPLVVDGINGPLTQRALANSYTNPYNQNTTADNIPVPKYTGTIPSISNDIQAKKIQAFNDRVTNDYSAKTAVTLTPMQQYQQNLKLVQGQIDSINAAYQDNLKLLIQQQNKEGSQRLGAANAMAANSGLIGSPSGQAILKNQQTANINAKDAAVAALRNRKNQTINDLMGGARKDISSQLQAKAEAKKAGADAYIKHLSEASDYRKNLLRKWLSGIVSGGTKLSDFSPEQLKEIESIYKVNSSDITDSYNTILQSNEQAKQQAKQASLNLESKQSAIDLTKAKTKQVGKVSPNVSAQIAAGDRRAAEKIKNKPIETNNYKFDKQATVDLYSAGENADSIKLLEKAIATHGIETVINNSGVSKKTKEALKINFGL